MVGCGLKKELFTLPLGPHRTVTAPALSTVGSDSQEAAFPRLSRLWRAYHCLSFHRRAVLCREQSCTKCFPATKNQGHSPPATGNQGPPDAEFPFTSGIKNTSIWTHPWIVKKAKLFFVQTGSHYINQIICLLLPPKRASLCSARLSF